VEAAAAAAGAPRLVLFFGGMRVVL
jgi:hypothetical protein